MGRVVIGMLGLGTVGSGVVRLLSQKRHLVLKKVAVRNLAKERPVNCPCSLTTNAAEVLDDPEVEIVVEVMGGERPALDFMRRAIEKRKHIVTANKEVLAKHGPELFEKARARGVAIFFEASVAGGIPLISTIHKGLEANEISAVTGILNGTTNFILSAMESGKSYGDALKQAQELGFAESDPTNDVEGHDVAYKLSILSALAYGRFVRSTDIYREGISRLTAEDLSNAREFGYKVKLIGTTRLEADHLAVRVHPTLVPLDHLLADVSGSHNGILVNGHAVGEITMVGPGAGQMPTASAVVGDIINLASALQLPDFASYFQTAVQSDWAETTAPGNWVCPFYLRILVGDHPGVIGQIGTIFGEHQISMRSILQKDTEHGDASISILTHGATNTAMMKALEQLQSLPFFKQLEGFIRIYQPAQV